MLKFIWHKWLTLFMLLRAPAEVDRWEGIFMSLCCQTSCHPNRIVSCHSCHHRFLCQPKLRYFLVLHVLLKFQPFIITISLCLKTGEICFDFDNHCLSNFQTQAWSDSKILSSWGNCFFKNWISHSFFWHKLSAVCNRGWQRSQWVGRNLRWCHSSVASGTAYPQVVVMN